MMVSTQKSNSFARGAAGKQCNRFSDLVVFCWLQPLPIRAAEELLQLLALPQYQDVRLYISCFEIYGGTCHHTLQTKSLCYSKSHAQYASQLCAH